MSVDLIITGKIVTQYGVFPETSLAVRDGKIVAIGATGSLPPAARTVDYGDLLILPGAVDTHTHSLGVKEEGHWHSTAAAAAGGVTTINDHPLDLGGAPASPAEIQGKSDKMASDVLIDYTLLAGGLPERLEEIPRAAQTGITGYKILMHATSGAASYGMRAVDDGELYGLFAEIAKVNQVAMIHAENEWIINYLVDRWTKEGKTYCAAHHETRPEVTETTAVFTGIEIARALNCRLHVLHLSVPRSFDLIEQARSEGVAVTGETCPHYLVCNEDRWRDVGAQFRINPPLRSEASRRGLWAKLRSGQIPVIASDHAPHPKIDAPSIFDNPSGTPGIEAMLPLLHSEGVVKGEISLPEVARVLAYNPARLLGIYPRKGSLQVGADADFAVFDPQKKWTVEGAKLVTQSKWSLYEGMPVTGAVLATYVRGEAVFADGQVNRDKKGHGRWIKKFADYRV